MLNRLFGAALMFCVSGAAYAETPPSSPVSEPASMRFEWIKEGPAEACGDHCREWIAASGPIAAETFQDFLLFTEVRSAKGATIVLDSGGGSVLGSLELGRKIRALSMTTTVGRIVKLPSAPGEEQRGTFSPRGECASMCAFVLLGGSERKIPGEARILVHQIWPGGKRYDAGAESYTAEEIVRIQRDVGRIARYTVDMGAGIELFEVAMRIPPWERLRALSPDELRRMGLQTITRVAETPTSGAITAARLPHASVPGRPERGWVYGEGSEENTVLRRHSLTREGEEIGQFELSLACADGDGRFKVAYLENRTLVDDAPAVQVSDVTVSLGGKRVALAVETSGPRDHALQTQASGSFGADQIETLRTDPDSVVVVSTKTSDDVRTLIRLGGTGFAKAYPRLKKDCGASH